MMGQVRIVGFVIGWVILLSESFVAFGETAAAFSLPKRSGGEMVRLQDFAGKILVLDFFAYWCAPCQKLSAGLETEVQEYYQMRNGNLHGIPVQVCSINVERDQPLKTDEFIRKTGVSLVLEDVAGVLDQYGGANLPLIVIIDGTGQRERFRVAHRHIGAEDITTIREVIDGIGGDREIDPLRGRDGSVVLRRVSASFEGEWSSDVSLTDTSLEYSQRGAGREYGLGISEGTMGIHYEPSPSDIVSQSASAAKNRTSIQGSLRQLIGPRFGLVGNAGWYSGYTDYRALWLNEYYRQLYEALDGYKEAKPGGYNLSGGMRWEYLPATAFLRVEGIFGYDTVSPGYEIAPFEPLRRGTQNLTTRGMRVSLENVISGRIRILNEVQAIDATDRAWRFSYQGSMNWAIAEHWVARSTLAGTREAPALWAGSGSLTVEREWRELWFLGLFTRYYHDTGQIENPLIISAATPELDTFQMGLGLRRRGEKIDFHLQVGPYFSWYGPVTRGSEPFARLYRDRDWFSVQSHVDYRF